MKSMEKIQHVPLLLPTRLYTEKECRKILKDLGLSNFYRLQVLVTVGVEVQELENIPKDTNLYNQIKEAKERGDLIHKFILQPEGSL